MTAHLVTHSSNIHPDHISHIICSRMAANVNQFRAREAASAGNDDDAAGGHDWLLTIPCRYLCTTAVGEVLLHLYGGVVTVPPSLSPLPPDDVAGNNVELRRAQLLHGIFADDQEHQVGRRVGRPHQQRQALLFALHPRTELDEVRSALPSPLPSALSVGSSSPTLLECDPIQLMDGALAARLVTHIAFQPHAAQAPTRLAGPLSRLDASTSGVEDDDGARGFLEAVSSSFHTSVLATLSIDVDIFDVELLPSLSGAREERMEGLRRVLPLLARDLPVVEASAVMRSRRIRGSHEDVLHVVFDVAAQHASVRASIAPTPFRAAGALHAPSGPRDESSLSSTTPWRRTLPIGSNSTSSHKVSTTASVLQGLYDIHTEAFEVHVHLEDLYDQMLKSLAAPGHVAVQDMGEASST